MRISIQTFFGGHEREPLRDYIKGVGRILEERGFAGVWLSEHVVTFDDYDPRYPYPYSDDGVAPTFLTELGMMDPMTALTALACSTSTLRLGTGVAILPQRNPVYFAKMGADIDVLSGGRFIPGIGLGWSGQEFAATNTPFEHRGARGDEYVEVVRNLWRDERASFSGQYYQLPRCLQQPKPVQRPHPPFYFGGHTAPALRRTARYGQGWFGHRLLPQDLPPLFSRLNEALEKEGRKPSDVDLAVSPGERPCDADTLARYAECGISEVATPCVALDLDGFTRQADTLANTLVRAASRL